MYMELAIFFIFGTIIGSFLNVVILRLGTGESIVSGRSRCYACGQDLRWYELVPLLSFAILRGRCRDCKSRISWQYPAVEFLTGLIFAAVLYEWWLNTAGFTGGWFITTELVFWAAFIALVVYDLRHKILPDRLSIIIAVTAFFFSMMSGKLTIDLWLAFAIAAFFSFLWVVSSGRWMGLGDAKLFFGVSLFLGWPLAMLATLLSFWSGALTGLALLVLQRNITMKTELPFAPFIFLGALTARFYGEQILAWYFTFI